MADTSGIKAGSAYVELFTKDSRLVKGLNAASKKIKAFGAGIAGWGAALSGVSAAVVAPLTAFAHSFAEGAHAMEQLSQKTGIGVAALSELKYAAEQSGVGVETLQTGIVKMQRSIVQAAKGSASAQQSLALLGLSVKDLSGLSPDAQFKLIADRLFKIQDPAVKAAVAMDLFGRGAVELFPMMQRGAAGIEAMQAEARKLGLTASEDGVKAGAELHRTLNTLQQVLAKLGSTIGAAVAPAITKMAKLMTDWAVKGIALVKQNKDLILRVFEVAKVVGLVGTALVALGGIIAGVGTVLGAIASVFVSIGSAVGFVATVLGAIISPIGLAIAGIVALGAEILYYTGAGAKALDWLKSKFDELAAFASDAWQGIGNALAAGDIALAAKILWLTLKVAWDRGVLELQKVWLSFAGFFQKIAYSAFYGVQAVAADLWHGLKVAWIEGAAFLQQVWATLADWHGKTVESMAEGMVKAWIWAQEKMGSISADEAKFQRDYLQQEQDVQRRQQEQAVAARKAEIEQQRSNASAGEQKRYEDRLAEIGKGYNDAEAAIEAEKARKIEETQKALDEARQAWQEALAEAQKKREAKEAAGGPEPGKPPKPGENPFAGLDDLMNATAKKTVGVSGTFNAREAQGLAFGGATDRIASASERTAQNTQKILDALREQGLEFG